MSKGIEKGVLGIVIRFTNPSERTSKKLWIVVEAFPLTKLKLI